MKSIHFESTTFLSVYDNKRSNTRSILLSFKKIENMTSINPLPSEWNDLTNDKVKNAIKIAWNYMTFENDTNNTPLKKADAIFILGAEDVRVASYAAELYQRGLAPLIIFSGKEGEITKGKFGGKSEALYFSEITEKLGVPKSAMILEEQSTNTGENIRFTLSLLKSRSVEIKSWIVVQKPYMLRRALMTLLKQGEGKFTRSNVQMTGPPIPVEEYANPSLGLELHIVLRNMCGDLQRIGVYPQLGFQVFSYIPPNVWKALKIISAAGFGSRCIRSVPNDISSIPVGFERDVQPSPTNLEQRIELLEDISNTIFHLDLRTTSADTESNENLLLLSSEPEKRVVAAVKASSSQVARGCILAKTPSEYYDKPLEYRAFLLKCSTSQLNKTILLETDGTVVNDLSAPLIKQKYVAIILPYVTKLKNEALSKILAPGFRLAENGEKVSGFSHGGVTPFGSLTPLPVIISRQTASENYIWLGGGLVDTKLRIFVKQLLQVGGSGVEGYKPVVADVAQPRVGDDTDI